MRDKKNIELQAFLNNIISINKTRKNFESLFSNKKINKKDIEHAYQGFFLEAVSGFELMIENIFIDFLIGNYKRTKPKIIFKDKRMASIRMILFNERNYFNWLPYKNTIDLSNLYFYKGHPFDSLGFNPKLKSDIENTKKNLDLILKTRNAIAHKSSYSKKKFLESIDGLSLRSSEKSPSGFLRSAINPNRNRYEDFISEINAFICRFRNIT